MEDKAKIIFGNEISDKDFRKACKKKAKFIKKFGDDSSVEYRFNDQENEVLSPIGVRNLILTDDGETEFDEKGIIVGNIRMGYGHYRISMAIASAAHALGYVPYWLDMNSYPESTATKLISYQNDLYSMGSRLSQKISLFNKLVWEPLNSEGFRKLTYNSADQKNAELMVPLINGLPKDIPFIATHVWPAQAAVHAGFSRVVNVIPDNWPMALHLAEGSIHTVQTPSSFVGYKNLRGMDKKRILKPMPKGSLFYVGHYVDHELVDNIEDDCMERLARLKNGEPRRFLLSIGGAGAQQKLFEEIIRHLVPEIKKGKATLFVNVGDHGDVWESIASHIPEADECAVRHTDDWNEAKEFTEGTDIDGLHVFSNKNIFPAVYLTNLLMRKSDVLITKPSELSFYPIPKIMIHRVGGHEAWGAVRAAETGDGTYELDKTDEVVAMIDRFISDGELLLSMCSNIKKAKDSGIYNGAYEAVNLAVQK